MDNKKILILSASIFFLILLISFASSDIGLVCPAGTIKISDVNNIKITDSYMACLLDATPFNRDRCVANGWEFLNQGRGSKFFERNFNIPLMPNSKVYLLDVNNNQNGLFAVDDRIKITTSLGVFDGYRTYYSVFKSEKIDITNLFPVNGGSANVKLLDVYGDMVGNSQLYFQIVSERCVRITCSRNSDCGTDGFVGEPSCDRNGDAVQDYKTFTCNLPGNPNSYCSDSTRQILKEDCRYGCSNGRCLPAPSIRCSGDSDCDDGNARTRDLCVNPGTSQSYCTNNEMNCLNDLDCGITGYLGHNYCGNNNVFKTFQEAVCKNPSTLNSYCMISQTPNLIQNCDDGNSQTEDLCVQLGNNAFCQHKLIDNPPVTRCSRNSDCGTRGFSGNLFCLSNDVFGSYTTYKCKYPGTTRSYCTSSVRNKLKKDCNDRKCSTKDSCVQPISGDPYCENIPLGCKKSSGR